MKYLGKIETVFSVILMVITAAFIISFQSERRGLLSQIDDLQVRLAEAVESPKVMYIHDSVPVYIHDVVEVDRTDYKKQLADRQLIKDLKLRISEIEAENRTLLSTRDTVVLDPLGDSVLTYRDKWAFFTYDISSRVLDWEVRDSLSTFVSTEYRHRFLWWRWGRKGYRVTIVNHNPRSRIEYSKYIKLK